MAIPEVCASVLVSDIRLFYQIHTVSFPLGINKVTILSYMSVSCTLYGCRSVTEL